MNYHQFAAGAAKFGLQQAIRSAVVYLVPIEVTLNYVRRYGRDGYVI